ncbi:uncharacterized protein B0H18DRAFT_1034819 [Fomitopsis serialis]|uniref:uncharacterized protein n=1 Tax=Fomitopsis serialis TaxID=139415 RepID=UPI002007798E|nr:uncharacterized protein B0H18DRAFT_1034819 [Neoantrodia serialis]KAH9917296.1 hypothetical protein B0H18DRAFT_1034819 [Neoantrodia serialis]
MDSQPLHLSSNFPTLRACALTQRAWVSRTRRYLFKASITNIIHSSSSTGTGVAQCVRDDPEASDIPLLEKPPQSLFTLLRLQTLHVMSTTLDSASDILLLLIAFPQVSCLHLRELRPPLQSLLLHGPARLPASRNATSDSKICIREMSIASSTHPVPLWVLSVLRQPPFKCAFQKFVWGWSSDRAEETSFLGMVDEAKDTLEELTVHCAANSGLLETMDLSQHSLLKFLGVVLIRSQTVDLPTYKFPPTFLVFLSRTPNSLRALHVPIIQTLLSNGAPQWSFMDWPRFDETLALLHKRNPHLVVSIVLTLGLERGNKHWAPRVVKSLVVRPLLSRLHCSLLAGLHVRLVFGFVALVPKERPGFSVLVPKKPPKVCYLWKLEEFVSTSVYMDAMRTINVGPLEVESAKCMRPASVMDS